jgi:hypothetical protein
MNKPHNITRTVACRWTVRCLLEMVTRSTEDRVLSPAGGSAGDLQDLLGSSTVNLHLSDPL